MKNNYIDLEYTISKINLQEITENELDDLIDSIIDVIDAKGYMVSGGAFIKSEEDLFKHETIIDTNIDFYNKPLDCTNNISNCPKQSSCKYPNCK